MNLRCHLGLHSWQFTPGPDNRMGERVCVGCGRREQQMGDGQTFLEET